MLQSQTGEDLEENLETLRTGGSRYTVFINQCWERLTVNIGIVLVFAAFYFIFLKNL
jgi:hypothetical protein